MHTLINIEINNYIHTKHNYTIFAGNGTLQIDKINTAPFMDQPEVYHRI